MARIIVTLETEDEASADMLRDELKAAENAAFRYLASEIRVGTPGSFDDAG